MKLVLIGYMGSGKSTIGRKLASTLASDFIDLDSRIENEEGTTIPELFSNKGEIYFRRKESESLKKIINTEPNFVLATGGGTPCYGDIMEFINSDENVISIYLKLSVEKLTDRLYTEKNDRPLIAHLNEKKDLKDFIRKHLFERSHYYNQANLVIDCSNLSTQEVTEAIILKLF